MADVWVVIIHKGSGLLGGVFSTIDNARSFIGTIPGAAFDVVFHTVDSNIGQEMAQADSTGADPSVGNVISLGGGKGI